METKRMYTAPQIELVELDNEISLALESTPPMGPNESRNIMPESYNDNPFAGRIV